MILRLLSTRKIVVVCLILNNLKVCGIVIRVSGATIVVESGFKLFVDRNLSAFWMQGLPVGFKIYEHGYHQTKIGMHLLITA